jgi:hypothetical protein
MANVIVGSIVFGILGYIIYRQIKSRRQGTGSCHSGCSGCPYACDHRITK